MASLSIIMLKYLLLILLLFSKVEAYKQDKQNEKDVWIDRYSMYTDYLSRAYTYLNISDRTKPVDEKKYLEKFYSCYGMSRHKGGPPCMNALNTAHFSNSRIWNSDISLKKRVPDCKYSIYMIKLKPSEKIPLLIECNLVIHQHTCQSDFTYKGGSTFFISAFNDEKVISCKYIDNRDNYYSVSCQFEISSVSSSSCLNMTVVVDYEHYDAFSDGLPGLTSKQFKGYNELKYTILDNQEFCVGASFLNPPTGYSFQLPTNQYRLKERVRYITGEWFTEAAFKRTPGMNTMYQYPNETMFSAYNFRQLTNQVSSVDIGLKVNDLTFPETVRLPTARSISQKYSHFRSQIISTDTETSVKSIVPIIDNNKMTYHFVGASHMRYIYDAIVAHYMTESIGLGGLKAHHGFVTRGNLKNYHSNIDYATILSDDLSDWLINLCSEFNSAARYSPGMRHTILLQTGAWDLNNSPIRRFLRAPETGAKILSAIIKILSKYDVCPKLDHFVWVNTVPHPMCFDDEEPLCQEHKGYRSNAGIAALIQYFYDGIFNTTIREGLTLSIVDSYSFILPRLLFHPDSESVCLSHYHCRVKVPDKNNSEPKLILAHTPSGIAMVQAVLTSLAI